jgi:hypothetical protein
VTARPPISLYDDDPFNVTLTRVADALLWDPARPLRIAATDTRNLHIVTQLVQLGGLSCDVIPDGDSGWLTVTIVGGE